MGVLSHREASSAVPAILGLLAMVTLAATPAISAPTALTRVTRAPRALKLVPADSDARCGQLTVRARFFLFKVTFYCLCHQTFVIALTLSVTTVM